MTERRTSLLVPGLLASIGFVVLIGLGTWQVERKAWKENLIATLSRRLNGPPQALTSTDMVRLNRADDEFRRVSVRGEFVAGKKQARVFTSGSPLRDDVKAPGAFIFAPAQLAANTLIAINRGYVPQPAMQGVALDVPQAPLELVGVLRWPSDPSWFTPPYSAADDLWFNADPSSMAARNHWGDVAPFYLELEAPAPPGGLPKPGRLRVSLPNDHLQYAITWYALAAVLALVFAFWLRGRRRGQA